MDTGLTRVVKLNGSARESIAEIFSDLERRVGVQVARMQQGKQIRIERSASMHHVGQGYEIRVDLPAGPIDAGYEAAMLDAFYATYKKEYGYKDAEAAVEVTDWYVMATVVGGGETLPLRLDGMDNAADPVVGERRAYFPELGGMTACKVINRYSLRPDYSIAGPALVEERESTTVVLPGDSLSVTQSGNLLISIGGKP